MSKKILKFTLTSAHTMQQSAVSQLFIPATAKVLKVDFQHGNLCAWVEIDSTCPNVIRELIVTPTGSQLPEVDLAVFELKYIDSAISDQLVYHVHESVYLSK